MTTFNSISYNIRNFRIGNVKFQTSRSNLPIYHCLLMGGKYSFCMISITARVICGFEGLEMISIE